MVHSNSNSNKFDFSSYIPEDKDQWLVQTPYGRGLVVRTTSRPLNSSTSPSTTHNTVTMREMQLLDWKRSDDTKSSSSSSRPSTLYSTISFPSVQPQVGDDVVCAFGRGRVVEIRNGDHSSHEMVVVLLSSWRLANTSRVTCILQSSAVQVVRQKQLHEMSVPEKVEHAQRLKEQAAKLFLQKQYNPALETYAHAVDAVRYIQHNTSTDSNNHVRADLLVVMITCSNNAATCCFQLQQWDRCMAFCKNVLTLLDAMEEQKGKKIHTILTKDGMYCDAKLFGEWRVKSLLLMARSHMEKKDTTEAMDVLRRARKVILHYTAAATTTTEGTASPEKQQQQDSDVWNASIKQLIANDREIQKLYKVCKERRKVEKEIEKQGAQKMFASPSITSSDEDEDHKEGDHDQKNTETEKEILSTSSCPSSIQKDAEDETATISSSTNSSINGGSTKQKKGIKKKVSFSNHVKRKLYEPEQELSGGGITDLSEDDEDANTGAVTSWVGGDLAFASVSFVVSVSCVFIAMRLFFSNKKQ